MDRPTARQRSSFGAWQMSTSHLKSRIAEVIPRARAIDMAEMLREGKSLEEISQAMGIAVSTVRSRLSQSGFSSRTGEPVKKKS